MKLKKQLEEKFKPVPDDAVSGDLRRTVDDGISRMPYRFYDDCCIHLFREIYKYLYYLKLIEKQCKHEDYRWLAETAIEKQDNIRGYHYILSHNENEKQKKAFMDAMSELMNSEFEFDDSEIVRAYIDENGKPHITVEDEKGNIEEL